jgi:hypothetical protein
MDTITLADGLDTFDVMIDSEDRELVAGFTWRILRVDSGMFYAQATRRQMYVYMHRLIAGAGPSEEVDHRNRNGLDNRKLNLRIATRSQNLANQPKQTRLGRASTSQFKGVCWDRARRKWAVYIAATEPGGPDRRRSLGRFDDEIEAAKAYDAAAIERWGEFAMLNFEREGKT